MSEQTTEAPTTEAPEGQEQGQQQVAAGQQQATEGQQRPADGQQAQGEQQQQPVEYTDFQVAEGVALDQDALGEFRTLASEARLSQDQAQKVVDLGVKMQQKWAAQQTQAMETARSQWAQASNTDKEFGGEKLAENLAVAKTALDKFGTPELQQLLNSSGLGNHPEVIRFFYRAGKAISDDRVIGGGNGPGPAIDPANVLFPSMK